MKGWKMQTWKEALMDDSRKPVGKEVLNSMSKGMKIIVPAGIG